VGILVTFVPPKVTARRGMSDMPTRGTAAGIVRSIKQKHQRQHKNAQRHRLTKHDRQIFLSESGADAPRRYAARLIQFHLKTWNAFK